MDNFKSQIVHVVNTVDKLAPTDRIEALSYLQKITEAFKNKSLPSELPTNTVPNAELFIKTTSKIGKHKCKNHLCLTNNIKHLKKIACFKCEKRLETEFQLFEHLQVHLDYPLSCIHCHCLFCNIEDFNSHKTVNCKQLSKECSLDTQKYLCTVCRSSFANKKAFHSHLLDNHGMKLYNNWYGCKLCQAMFEQKKMLYHHHKQAHSDLNSQWEITTNENKDMLNTQNEQSSEQTSLDSEDADKFQCSHCNKHFNKKCMLSAHVKRHLRNREYVCVLCKKSFSVYKYYKRHLQCASHRSKDGLDNHPLFKCELCADKVFANHDSLSRHHLRIHLSADRLLKCPLCDFKTGLPASLTRHVNLHTDNRKFICDQCGTCFHTLSALKEHTVYVHSDERNYSCEICGQRFKLKTGLNRHLKTHSDYKEFKCFICSQVYKFRTNLKRHLMNTHKMSDKNNRVFRVTTEEEGYAVNNPKVVSRKSAKQKKLDELNTNRIEDFDISSLDTLCNVALSCGGEVFRETYDNFVKYSPDNSESQESLSCMLAPVNNLIDHVLQDTNNDIKINKLTLDNTRQYISPNDDSLNHLLAMNYRSTTCRQYLSSTFGDFSSDQCSQQTNIKMNHQYSNSVSNLNSMMCDGYNKQCVVTHHLQDIAVEDESSLPYTKWLNENI